jgi:hypothetical protein
MISIGKPALRCAPQHLGTGRVLPAGPVHRTGSPGQGCGEGADLRSHRLSLYDLLVNAAIATGWLSERRTLRGRSLDKDATVMVTAKDVLVAGTVLTGAAALVGKVVTQREPPASQFVSGDELPDAVINADGNRRYLQTMTELNRTFALLGVAATPFINFALFDSYHPYPLRSFFSLW